MLKASRVSIAKRRPTGFSAQRVEGQYNNRIRHGQCTKQLHQASVQAPAKNAGVDIDNNLFSITDIGMRIESNILNV